MLNVGRIDN